MRDGSIPPGWSYNPSRCIERLILVLLALAGFGIALYLSLYQWAVFSTVWERFSARGAKMFFTLN